MLRMLIARANKTPSVVIIINASGHRTATRPIKTLYTNASPRIGISEADWSEKKYVRVFGGPRRLVNGEMAAIVAMAIFLTCRITILALQLWASALLHHLRGPS